MPAPRDREVNSQTNPFFIRISDGVTAAAVDAASQALMVRMVDASGTIVGDVRITDGADVFSVFKDGDARAGGTGGVAVLDSDVANYQVVAVEEDGRVEVSDADGVLSVDDAGGNLTVDAAVTADQGAAVALAGAWPIKITDGVDVYSTIVGREV